MKVENVQIEIKNKEHYEAVKKRLQELGKWCWTSSFSDKTAATCKYKVRIYLHQNGNTSWDEIRHQNRPKYKLITLDDLYEVEKEKVIKEKFKIKGQKYSSLKPAPVFNCDTRQEALEYIKKQESGTYEIKKYYEIVEE